MKQYTQYVYRDNAWRAVGSIPILPDGVYHINISGSGSIWEPDKCAALWYTTVNDSRISSLTDGLSISLKIPSVDEGGQLGVLLNINSLGYHPVVYDVNTSIGDRYSVGSTIILTYNASQTATAYYNSSTAITYTGCWQINDAGSGDEALATSYSHGTVSGEAQWDDTHDQLFFSVEDSNTNDSNGLTIATNGVNLYSNGASVWVDKYGQITLSSGLELPSLVLNATDGVFISKLKAPTENEHPATKKYVDDSITALPEPMIFKGSLGTGGTITSLPTASSSNEGFTYKVITAGTYASQAAKVGDTFISDGSAWVLIPSGDEPSGTVTSITIDATSPISIDSNSAITTSGSRTISHANSGVTAGTYRSVTVNATGHVTAGTNPTTISEYGIADAKINNGVITLGSNTITPLTASSTLDATKLNGTIPSGCYTDTKNTAGSTDSSSKLFLVGATSQAANPQTYSQDTAYVGTDGHLYSNSIQVVNLSGTQSLTNKTYNGLTLTKATTGFTIAGGTTSRTLTVNNTYTLGAACAKAVDSSISAASTSTNLPTSQAVANFVEGKGYTTNTGTITGVSVNGTSIATSGTANITSIPTSILSGVDTSITSGSTSTSIPTTAAVATYVDNHTVTVENASSTVVGGLKVRLDDSTHTLYITNNGQDA